MVAPGKEPAKAGSSTNPPPEEGETNLTALPETELEGNADDDNIGNKTIVNLSDIKQWQFPTMVTPWTYQPEFSRTVFQYNVGEASKASNSPLINQIGTLVGNLADDKKPRPTPLRQLTQDSQRRP